MTSQNCIHVVASVSSLVSLLDVIIDLPIDPPSLYIGLEGAKLGRHGSIAFISLQVHPRKDIYLIDVYRLDKLAFSTMNSSAASLKTVLESPTIPKVIFDVRKGSDALYGLYGITVDGIRDLQLMELGCRKGLKDTVAGLAKCIETDTVISAAIKADWQRTKEEADRLSLTEWGGSYEVFTERPSRPEIVRYCAYSVAHLPELYKAYKSKLCRPGEAFWQAEVQQATQERIKLSKIRAYQGEAITTYHSPWDEEYIERAIDQWNEDVLCDAMNDEADVFLLDDYAGFYEEMEEYDEHYSEDDTARDCIGWEEDMIKNGEYF